MNQSQSQLFAQLIQGIYGAERTEALLQELDSLLSRAAKRDLKPPSHGKELSEKDAFLITYPDMVRSSGEPPLRTLQRLLKKRLLGAISGVHLLPFFPFSSDDGFSVVDYRAVDPAYGTWSDVEAIGSDFRLMVDAVINHISAQSEWFQGFLKGQAPYTDYFIVTDPGMDLSEVVRPRDLPLVTSFSTAQGERTVWTTFSEDQIDLNYANPEVLLEVVSVILDYVRYGAQVLRLDAVAFLWKEPGTSSIHLTQTHLIIQLIRAVLEAVAPWVVLITETNVPHEENLSYFGDGTNEAHLVYQFPLPPLVLYTLRTGDADPMADWIRGLRLPSQEASFFNFLASHDGIGLRPAQDLLPVAAVEELVRHTETCGGGITYRQTTGGRLPYELNITYLDALSHPGELDDDPATAVRRFLSAHSLLLSLQGVPAIYFHSLFGSRNDKQGVAATGRLRSINREKLDLAELELELANPRSIRSQVFGGMRRMLQVRRNHKAFHPRSEQEVLDLPRGFIAIRRTPDDGSSPVTLLHNTTDQPARIPLSARSDALHQDLLSGERLDSAGIHVESWGYRWLIETDHS